MSVKDQLSPYLNRFLILCEQKSNVKLELCCDNGQVSVNLSHALEVVSPTSPNEIQKKEKYSEILKKKNIGTSQLNRLQKRAFDRAEEAKKEAKLQQEIAEQAKLEAVEARHKAEKAKKEAEEIGNITNNTKLVKEEKTKVIDGVCDRITHEHEKASESGSIFCKRVSL